MFERQLPDFLEAENAFFFLFAHMKEELLKTRDVKLNVMQEILNTAWK